MPGSMKRSPAASLLSIEELAQRLGVSVRHVRRLVAERRVPYLKWGRLLRFEPAEVEAWLDSARVAATVDAPRGRRLANNTLIDRR